MCTVPTDTRVYVAEQLHQCNHELSFPSVSYVNSKIAEQTVDLLRSCVIPKDYIARRYHDDITSRAMLQSSKPWGDGRMFKMLVDCLPKPAVTLHL